MSLLENVTGFQDNQFLVNNIHFLVNKLKTTGSLLDKETRKETNCADRRKIKLELDLKLHQENVFLGD
jgi:hypothetical protein